MLGPHRWPPPPPPRPVSVRIHVPRAASFQGRGGPSAPPRVPPLEGCRRDALLLARWAPRGGPERWPRCRCRAPSAQVQPGAPQVQPRGARAPPGGGSGSAAPARIPRPPKPQQRFPPPESVAVPSRRHHRGHLARCLGPVGTPGFSGRPRGGPPPSASGCAAPFSEASWLVLALGRWLRPDPGSPPHPRPAAASPFCRVSSGACTGPSPARWAHLRPGSAFPAPRPGEVPWEHRQCLCCPPSPLWTREPHVLGVQAWEGAGGFSHISLSCEDEDAPDRAVRARGRRRWGGGSGAPTRTRAVSAGLGCLSPALTLGARASHFASWAPVPCSVRCEHYYLPRRVW